MGSYGKEMVIKIESSKRALSTSLFASMVQDVFPIIVTNKLQNCFRLFWATLLKGSQFQIKTKLSKSVAL